MSRDRTPEKRQRILDAALKVFAARGFYTAKVSEVAREAGVADGTIYLYFENKDDLLISLFEDRMDFLIRRLTDDLAVTGGTVAQRVRRLIHMHLRIVAESPELAEFITVELRQSQKFVKEYTNPRFQAYLKVLRDLIEAGQSDGTIRADLDPRTIVRAIFGALDELLLAMTLVKKKGREPDLVRPADDLADLFLNGMLTPAGRASAH